jgi:uncharacterized membrane protein
MNYSPVLIVHICAGMIAVLSGFAALFVRKGSPLHRKTGDAFVISMLLMSAGGAYLGAMKSQRMNVIAGLFTFYLVATAWLTMRRKPKETGSLEVGLLLMGLLVGVTALFFGWQAAHTANRAIFIMGYVFGSAVLLSVIGDTRLIIRGGVAGVQRLVRHLWRMCVALFVASGSFFLGTAGDPRVGLRARIFTPAVRATHLPQLPVLLVVVVMVFWLFRVRLSRRYKRAAA